MAVNDYLMLKVIGRNQAQNIVNSLCWEIIAQVGSEAVVCQALCDVWVTQKKATWLLAHSDDYTLIGLKAYSLTGDPKVPGQALIDEAGGVAQVTLPAHVCRTITLYPTGVKMKHRGRIMLSGTSAEMLTAADGGLTSAAVTLLDNVADDLMAGVASGGNDFELRIWGKDDAEPPEDAAHEISVAKGRRTPSSVTSRRIRELLIG